tara:strand:+ start:579 stop:866 length:288 start_codon:yes stop_codon:yes gene_type:complete
LNKEAGFIGGAVERSFVGDEPDLSINSGPRFTGRFFFAAIVFCEALPASEIAEDPNHETPKARKDDKKGKWDEDDYPHRQVGWWDLFVHANEDSC